jgi:cell division transport system ATP-binding protein
VVETRQFEPIVEMNNVGLAYGDNPEVLKNINFAFRRGSMHFLTGKSGAGKTSLLSMLYLAQKPTSGTLKVFGNNISLTDRDTLAFLRRRIGVVFQDFRLLDHLSVFDNVALPLRIRGMKEKEIRKRVIELLAWVELTDNMYAKSSEISGGEKQRAAIARAVINRPELLLADEPTGNVDNEIANKLMKLFAELNRLGTTVVIATHSNELMERYNYPRIQLKDGNISYIKG